MQTHNVPAQTGQNCYDLITFRATLINKCQEYFENPDYDKELAKEINLYPEPVSTLAQLGLCRPTV
jgi:hypothetical protein